MSLIFLEMFFFSCTGLTSRVKLVEIMVTFKE